MLKKNLLAFFFLCLPLTSCLYAQGTNNPPWAGMPLPPSNQGAVIVLNEWKKSPDRIDRDMCAPLVFASTGRVLGAPKSDTKETMAKWAITYQLPNTRNEFGLAGRGTVAEAGRGENTYYIKKYAYNVSFNDGSTIAYGQLNEATLTADPYDKNNPNGVGVASIAAIHIPSRVRELRCYYSVFTEFGRDHLEFLISQLRWLKTN
jgi:hypothetical protein